MCKFTSSIIITMAYMYTYTYIYALHRHAIQMPISTSFSYYSYIFNLSFDGINFLALRFSFASTFIIKKNLSFCSVHVSIFSVLDISISYLRKKQWTLLLNKLFHFFIEFRYTRKEFVILEYVFVLPLELL